jgi:drug/metabolite transporter (DMT)-like permease
MNDKPTGSSLLGGWLSAAGVVCIWSGWLVVSRLGVIQTLTIYDMMALRFAVAIVAVSPFIWRYWPRHMRLWQIILISFGQGAPFMMLAFGGLQFAPAAHAAVVTNGTLPIFAAIIGWIWMKDRPDRWRIFGIAVILVGCSLIGWDRDTVGAGPDSWIGHLMFAGGGLLVAINLIATKTWGLTGMQAMVSIPTINLAWFAPVYLAFLPKALDRAPWPEILLQAGYQGVLPSLVGVLLFTNAIRTIGTTPTAAMMAMVPAGAALLAIPVLGEWPSLYAWAGIFLATAGIRLAAGWRPGRG